MIKSIAVYNGKDIWDFETLQRHALLVYGWIWSNAGMGSRTEDVVKERLCICPLHEQTFNIKSLKDPKHRLSLFVPFLKKYALIHEKSDDYERSR